MPRDLVMKEFIKFKYSHIFDFLKNPEFFFVNQEVTGDELENTDFKTENTLVKKKREK